MKKHLLLLSLPLLALASNEAINKKIESLENEIRLLKEQVNNNTHDLDERMPIIEEVEKKSILDKLNISPELMLRADKMDYKSGKIEGEETQILDPNHEFYLQQRRDEYSKNFDLAGEVRLRLNMDMQVDNTIKFNGRVVYVNSSQSNQRLCILSRDIKSESAPGVLAVDRAYIDYTPNKESDYAFTFSFGILPTSGGTPMQYSQDKQRNSMFPALVFNMNSYGFIGTQRLGTDTFVRAILAKAYTMEPAYYPYQCNRENIDNANIMGLYADTKIDYFGKSLLSFGVNMLGDLKAHPYLGPDVSSNNAEPLGDMLTLGLGLDIEKVANSDATIFLHTALSVPNANGKTDDYKIVAIPSVQDLSDGLTQDGSVGFTTADYASGEMLASNGYSIYFGTKYDISTAFNVGAEYNYGSKYWFSATQGAEDMYNKLATRGEVFEVYGTWRLNKYLSTKLGFMQIHEDYTGSGWHFGEPAKKDAMQSISYITVDAKF
ncbi:DUF3373 family protein [bacterium]|nr:DUF3373 family protein [bacterium]MBU1434949.1 DUF3373 family protein [bacterium]MBU1504054.1 DUF3373 family protein [bacterium]